MDCNCIPCASNYVPGTLQQISKWGIKEIEGGGTYGLPLDEYKKMLADNKLTMVSVGAIFNC
jgi:hypothetical protein